MGVSAKIETRRVTANDFEMRANSAGDMMLFSGYAAVFNSDSEPLPFIERIASGAFTKSLRSKNKVSMYMNHDATMLLGTTRSGTLRLTEDSKGLAVEADLPQTTVGKDLSILMQRGDVNSMSFGFSVPAGGDRWSDNGMRRELLQIRLHEVSVVTGFPAYTATEASVRSFEALATRTGVDADQLSVAIVALETGQTLTVDQGALLRETVAKLVPAANDSVQGSVSRVGVLRKHLDLLRDVV